MVYYQAQKEKPDEKPKVLVVSNEIEGARPWEYALTELGLLTKLVCFNEQPLEVYFENSPDLIILEYLNPNNNELEFCKKLRQVSAVPLLYLTSETNEAYLYEAYKAGVDDCITLPISPRIFQAKIRAWLRRIQTMPLAALDMILLGGITLLVSKRQIILPSGGIIKLTSIESRLLFVLMSQPNKTIDRKQLVSRVWGHYGNGDETLLKNLIYRLRRKIEADPHHPKFLLTDSDIGYYFHQEDSQDFT